MPYPEGWTLYASEAVKKVVKIPVIISHSLRTPAYCDQVIGEGRTDMVGIARQLLADPYWPLKAKYGKDEEIRKCISCLTGCWQEAHMTKKQVTCAINPTCGNESFAKMKPTDKPCSIAVVGGGPAGMEAARHAAVRGHNVTLFEKNGELGGAILGDCAVVGKEKMKWYADWIRAQISKLPNVKVMLNHSPSVSDLEAFDIVANATGASSYVPLVFGNADAVVPFEKVLVCPKNCPHNPGGRKAVELGQRVLVWGDHYAAVDTAQHLASIGKEVTVVTENPAFASRVEVIHMYVTRKRFAQNEAEALEPDPYKYPVTVLEGTTVLNIADGTVTVQATNFEKQDIFIDSVVTCHVQPNLELLHEAVEAGLQVVNIGDSVSVRNLRAAVLDGATFGKNIEGHALTNPNHAPVNDLPIDVLEQMLR
jgi:NADPH-dependent 2,4-dienoyl-CoA reductase/sulfur reductase-like enzyme